MTDHRHEYDADDWTVRELADRLDRGDPEGIAHVVRALTARLAVALADPPRQTDPYTMLHDTAHAILSLADAVKSLADANFGGAIADDVEVRADVEDTIEQANSAGAGVHEMARWV